MKKTKWLFCTFLCLPMLASCGENKPEEHVHNYGNWIAEVPASCESDGVKGHYHCSDCNKDFDANKVELSSLVISAKGHNYGDWIDEVPATCTADGTLGHYHCEQCDKDFDNEYHELASLVIPATGHAINDIGYCASCDRFISCSAYTEEYYTKNDLYFSNPFTNFPYHYMRLDVYTGGHILKMKVTVNNSDVTEQFITDNFKFYNNDHVLLTHSASGSYILWTPASIGSYYITYNDGNCYSSDWSIHQPTITITLHEYNEIGECIHCAYKNYTEYTYDDAKTLNIESQKLVLNQASKYYKLSSGAQVYSGAKIHFTAYHSNAATEYFEFHAYQVIDEVITELSTTQVYEDYQTDSKYNAHSKEFATYEVTCINSSPVYYSVKNILVFGMNQYMCSFISTWSTDADMEDFPLEAGKPNFFSQTLTTGVTYQFDAPVEDSNGNKATLQVLNSSTHQPIDLEHKYYHDTETFEVPADGTYDVVIKTFSGTLMTANINVL